MLMLKSEFFTFVVIYARKIYSEGWGGTWRTNSSKVCDKFKALEGVSGISREGKILTRGSSKGEHTYKLWHGFEKRV
jgi:hypothetical protein